MNDSFIEYFDPLVPLEDLVRALYARYAVRPLVREVISNFLVVLKRKDMETYRHSLRVSIVAAKIGEHALMDPKPLFYGGLMHDIGKALVDPDVLKKRARFDERDHKAMRSHAMDGYRMLRGILDYTADVIVRHHAFQERGYPSVLPIPLHPYGERRLDEYGRLLMIADVFDAAHRRNNRGEGIRSGDDIRRFMLATFPSDRDLIGELYTVGIFTAQTY